MLMASQLEVKFGKSWWKGIQYHRGDSPVLISSHLSRLPLEIVETRTSRMLFTSPQGKGLK